MIIVSSLAQVRATLARTAATHVISLLAPSGEMPVFPTLAAGHHLRLAFHDIAEHRADMIMPEPEHVKLMLNFVTDWPRQKPLLIHCYAGISRSTAAAYITACALKPEADERQLAFQLREASPTATPNPLLIAYADHLLNRDGAMVRAIQDIGRGAEAFEGLPFKLAL